jgi:hypothetical protein
MVRSFVHDDRGAVTIDWVTLSAGILVLGLVVVYSVMGNSAGYLMDEFEQLNGEVESLGDVVSTAQQNTNINQ